MDHPIYSYPLDRVLEALGAKRGAARDMWFSPLRVESNASLHVKRSDNVWYDQGAGVGGTNVQLVMMAKHCSKAEAEQFIASLDPVLESERKAAAEAVSAPKQEIKRIRDIKCDYLTNYLETRKIPLDLARQYCKELLVYNPVRGINYTLVGFPSNSGWIMSSPNGFKSTTKADVTTINTSGRVSNTPSSRTVAVFEGFWDFLSWQLMQCSRKPSCDMVVLNSVNNLRKAADYIGRHDKAVCFLDNDKAGRECTRAVENIMRGKEVLDMSELYQGHKDLNEMLQASRGYSSNLSMHM